MATMPASPPPRTTIDAVVKGRHGDPFAVLGLHEDEGEWCCAHSCPAPIRSSTALTPRRRIRWPLERRHPDGFFEGLPAAARTVTGCGPPTRQAWTVDDPYAFGPVLGPLDVWLLGEGTHARLYDRLGAHLIEHEGVAGVHFAVWAPNARRVSVVGDFNAWDGRRHADAQARRYRRVGDFCAGARRRHAVQIRDHRRRRRAAAAEGRSVRLRRRAAAVDGLGGRATPTAFAWTDAAGCRARAARSAARADVDLRSASGLVAARRRRPLAHLRRARRRAHALRRRHGLHPSRADAGQRASARRLVGLSADRPVRADRALRRSGRLRALRRSLRMRRASA